MESLDVSILLLCVVAVIVVAGVILLVLPGFLLRRRATRDYRDARGTQHRQYVEQGLMSVRARVARLQADVRRIDDRVAGTEQEELGELDQALTRHLSLTRLDDVPGLGPGRVKVIIDNVFRSQLSDLHTAHLLPTIGPATQSAISRWVNENQARWPQLRNEAFSGRQEIVNRYAPFLRDLDQERTALIDRIATLQALEHRAADELLRLSTTTVDDFHRVLMERKDAKAAEEIQRYLLGLFAPWAMVPAWYAELLTAAEGEGAGGHAA